MAKRKSDDMTPGDDFTDEELHKLFTFSNYHYVSSMESLLKKTESTARITSVPIGVLQPLFLAIDDIYGGNEVGEQEAAFAGGHINLLREMCDTLLQCCWHRRDPHSLRRICYQKWLLARSDAIRDSDVQVQSRSKTLHLYNTLRRAVFSEAYETVLELRGFTENDYILPFSMTQFPGRKIDDIIPALVALVLWKFGNISPDVQWLQQDENLAVRGTTHRFTELLRPLCKCLKDLGSDVSVPTLFTTRRACTRKQIEFLVDNLQDDDASGHEKTLRSTLQSFMSTSSSKAFVTRFGRQHLRLAKTGLTLECEVPRLEITLTIDESVQDQAFFIPVWSYIGEREDAGFWTETEYLMLPGTEVIFSDLVCANPVPNYSSDYLITMSAKVIGFDPDLQKLKSVPLVHQRISHDHFVDHMSHAIASMFLYQ